MFITNTNITIKYTLSPTNTMYALTDFDLVTKLPDKTVTYNNNVTGLLGLAFVAPTNTTKGNLEFIYNPGTAIGLHKLILSIGTGVAYKEHSKILINIVDTNTVKTIRVQLP